MRGRAQVYFNGRMVPEHEARVSIFDSALMFGDMVSIRRSASRFPLPASPLPAPLLLRL